LQYFPPLSTLFFRLMSQADRIATLEYRVAELEAMLARVTRERDILLRRHENPANQQPPPQQQPHPHHRTSNHHEQQDKQHTYSEKAPSGIRLIIARPVSTLS
jgi:hypothetical protein